MRKLVNKKTTYNKIFFYFEIVILFFKFSMHNRYFQNWIDRENTKDTGHNYNKI